MLLMQRSTSTPLSQISLALSQHGRHTLRHDKAYSTIFYKCIIHYCSGHWLLWLFSFYPFIEKTSGFSHIFRFSPLRKSSRQSSPARFFYTHASSGPNSNILQHTPPSQWLSEATEMLMLVWLDFNSNYLILPLLNRYNVVLAWCIGQKYNWFIPQRNIVVFKLRSEVTGLSERRLLRTYCWKVVQNETKDRGSRDIG